MIFDSNLFGLDKKEMNNKESKTFKVSKRVLELEKLERI
jgi:hypothetical protein